MRFYQYGLVLTLLAVQCSPPDRYDTASLDEGVTKLIMLKENDRVSQTQVLSDEDLAERVVNLRRLKDGLKQALSLWGIEITNDYDYLPILGVKIGDEDILAKLRDRPDVSRIEDETLLYPAIAESFPFVRQPAPVASGFTGAGTAVAVIDTGVDYTRAAFGACTAPGIPVNTCRVAFAKDFETPDNVLDEPTLHGTNVAAIVAGFAPGTKILALDAANKGVFRSSVVVETINWVITNKSKYNIVAMNISMGGGLSTTTCPSTPMAVALRDAKRAGILTSVSSGNSAQSNGLMNPACAPDAVSVGAVYDRTYKPVNLSTCSDPEPKANKVTCFSNSASFLTMLAPGWSIKAADVYGGGTSQAAPHVAGAIAVLKARFPSETPDQIVNRLTRTGVPTLDTRNNITKPRLDLTAAVGNFCSIVASPIDVNAQATGGSFNISLSLGKNCTWTAATSVTWSQISKANGTGSDQLSLTVQPSSSGSREGLLQLTSSAGPVQVRIIQKS